MYCTVQFVIILTSSNHKLAHPSHTTSTPERIHGTSHGSPIDQRGGISETHPRLQSRRLGEGAEDLDSGGHGSGTADHQGSAQHGAVDAL